MRLPDDGPHLMMDPGMPQKTKNTTQMRLPRGVRQIVGRGAPSVRQNYPLRTPLDRLVGAWP